MATYDELRSLFGDGDLQRKLEVAVLVAAQTILSGQDTTNPPWSQEAGQHEVRAKWANAALSNTSAEAVRMLRFVLAANKDLTVAQIQAVTDTQVQNAVNAILDEIASAAYGG